MFLRGRMAGSRFETSSPRYTSGLASAKGGGWSWWLKRLCWLEKVAASRGAEWKLRIGKRVVVQNKMKLISVRYWFIHVAHSLKMMAWLASGESSLPHAEAGQDNMVAVILPSMSVSLWDMHDQSLWSTLGSRMPRCRNLTTAS